MRFNSLTFIVFFAVVLAVHRLPIPWRWKKINLVLASYAFYAAWNPPFVVLLWISTLTDWWVARWIDRSEGPGRRRLLLLASLAVNLGLLGYFKYGGFLLESFTDGMAWLGVDFEAATPSILLPVGISFYTFQSLSYTLDVYHRRMRPWSSPLDFTLFVTFFPQLVAGPIVRARDFLPQCLAGRSVSARQLGWGLALIVLGLFEKTVVADSLLDPIVAAVYDGPGAPGPWLAWCATTAFAGQIFSDFSGYSLCAIGAAFCLGFSLPDNFRFPYASVGFSDFWRRWHISLSSWLRDYLYIPLGGNRRGTFRTGENLMITMLLGGLWHGAAWTFVLWGGLHGAYLLVERLLRARFGHAAVWQRSGGQLVLAAATFALGCIAWVFFRASSFERASEIVLAMLGASPGDGRMNVELLPQVIATVTVAATLCVHWVMRNRSLAEVAAELPWWVHSVSIAAMLLLVVVVTGENRAFIYFQF